MVVTEAMAAVVAAEVARGHAQGRARGHTIAEGGQGPGVAAGIVAEAETGIADPDPDLRLYKLVRLGTG